MARKASARAEESGPAERRAWHDVARGWRAMANSVMHEDLDGGVEAGEVGPVPLNARRH